MVTGGEMRKDLGKQGGDRKASCTRANSLRQISIIRVENSWFTLWRYLKAWPHSFALDPSSTTFWESSPADPIATPTYPKRSRHSLYPHISSEFPILVKGVLRVSLFTPNTSIGLLLKLYPDSILLSDQLKIQVCWNNSPWDSLGPIVSVYARELVSTSLVLCGLICLLPAASPPILVSASPQTEPYF